MSDQLYHKKHGGKGTISDSKQSELDNAIRKHKNNITTIKKFVLVVLW